MHEDDSPMFVIPLIDPDAHAREVDWEVAQADEFRMSIERMFDGMDPVHLLTLYRMLHALRGDAPNCLYFAGQAQTILRVVHKMCRTCESVSHTTVDHVTATSVGDEVDPDITEKHDSLLTKEQLLVKYNLEYLPDANEGRGAYRCRSCRLDYRSIGDRAQQGFACPSCEAPSKLGMDK